MQDFDRNDITATERMAICYGRGMALAVFDWIRSCCVVKTPAGRFILDLPSKKTVQVLKAVIAYKEKAVHAKIKGAPHCNLTMLKAQVANVLMCDPSIKEWWEKSAGIPSDQMGLKLPGYGIEWQADGRIPACEFTLLQCKINTQCYNRRISEDRHDAL
jgi:hypothetical protein